MEIRKECLACGTKLGDVRICPGCDGTKFKEFAAQIVNPPEPFAAPTSPEPPVVRLSPPLRKKEPPGQEKAAAPRPQHMLPRRPLGILAPYEEIKYAEQVIEHARVMGVDLLMLEKAMRHLKRARELEMMEEDNPITVSNYAQKAQNIALDLIHRGLLPPPPESLADKEGRQPPAPPLPPRSGTQKNCVNCGMPREFEDWAVCPYCNWRHQTQKSEKAPAAPQVKGGAIIDRSKLRIPLSQDLYEQHNRLTEIHDFFVRSFGAPVLSNVHDNLRLFHNLETTEQRKSELLRDSTSRLEKFLRQDASEAHLKELQAKGHIEFSGGR